MRERELVEKGRDGLKSGRKGLRMKEMAVEGLKTEKKRWKGCGGREVLGRGGKGRGGEGRRRVRHDKWEGKMERKRKTKGRIYMGEGRGRKGREEGERKGKRRQRREEKMEEKYELQRRNK